MTNLRTYEERASAHRHPLARKLLQIISTKKTNLALSADVTSCDALLKLADVCGPHICVLKTHVDILSDFNPASDFIAKLTALSVKHNFFIFEDRKFADIGSTVQHQYRDGVYKISSWSHIVNAHTLPGEGIISGLKSVASERGVVEFENRGLLLLAEMSSKDNLFTAEYKRKTLEMARKHRDFVIGFVAQGAVKGTGDVEDREGHEEDFIVFTPGVNLGQEGDSLGQQYNTPEKVVGEMGSDIIIVGRGIFGQGEDGVEKAAVRSKEEGWKAYEKRVGKK